MAIFKVYNEDKEKLEGYLNTPRHNLEPAIKLLDLVKKMEFGTLNVTLRVHEGMITDLVVQKYGRKRYKNESSQKVMDDILSKVDEIKNGQFVVNLRVADGQITDSMPQEQKRWQYPLQKS